MSTRPEQPEKFLRGCLYPGFGDVPYPRINPTAVEHVPIDVWEAAQIPAGVRIEVMGDAEAVDIAYHTSTVNYGQRGENAGCSFVAYRGTQKISEVRAVLGEGVARLALTGEPTRPAIIYLPEGMKPLVTSVMAIGGRLESAPALPRWLAYGDAMTQGWMAPSPAMAWPSVAARKLGLDLVNLGFAGSARGETSMAVMMAEQPAEAISVAFGQSNWDKVPHTPALLGQETRVFLKILRLSHPNAPIVVMSPTLRPDAEQSKNILGVTLADLRASMDEAVEEMVAAGDTRLWLLHGDSVLADSDLVDGVYPNEEGHKRLAAGVSKYFNPLLAEMKAAMLARKQEEVLARAPGLTLSLNLDLAQTVAPSPPPPPPNVVPVVLPGDGSSSGGVVLSPPPAVSRAPAVSPPVEPSRPLEPPAYVSMEIQHEAHEMPIAAPLPSGAVSGQPVYVQVLDPATGRVQLVEVPQGAQVPTPAPSVQPPPPPPPPVSASDLAVAIPPPPQVSVPEALVTVPELTVVQSDSATGEVDDDTDSTTGTDSVAAPGFGSIAEGVNEADDLQRIGEDIQTDGLEQIQDVQPVGALEDVQPVGALVGEIIGDGDGDGVDVLSASTPDDDWDASPSRPMGGPVLLPARNPAGRQDPAVSRDSGAQTEDAMGLELVVTGPAESQLETVRSEFETADFASYADSSDPAAAEIGPEPMVEAQVVEADVVDPEMVRFMEQQQADSQALESVGMAISQVATAMMAAQSAVAQVAASVEGAVLGSGAPETAAQSADGVPPEGGDGGQAQGEWSNLDATSTQDRLTDTLVDQAGALVPVGPPPETVPQPLEMVEMAISQVATAMQVAQSAVAQVAAAVEGAVMTHVASIAAQMEEADMMELEAAGEVPVPAPAGQVSGSAAPVDPTPAIL